MSSPVRDLDDDEMLTRLHPGSQEGMVGCLLSGRVSEEKMTICYMLVTTVDTLEMM